VVSAVNAGPPPTVDLLLGGITVGPVRVLSSYFPRAGDTVWCRQNGTDVFILGALHTEALTGVTRRIATASVSTNSLGIASTETVMITVVAATVNGRVYKVTADVGFQVSIVADAHAARIREDSVSGNELQARRYTAPQTTPQLWPLHIEGEYTADATENKTFVLTFQRTTGSGTSTLTATTDYRSRLYVDYLSG
jgi:hypothetical protein